MRFIGFDANGTDGSDILAFDIDYEDGGVLRKIAVASLTPEQIEAVREVASIGDAAVDALLPELIRE